MCFQNNSIAWSSHRPTGFVEWDQGRGLTRLQVLTNTNSSGDFLFERSSKVDKTFHQGHYHLCTVLIGSPGPLHMDYVTIPCSERIHVSGIMCMDGGDSVWKLPDVYYRLTHLKIASGKSSIKNNTGIELFNFNYMCNLVYTSKECAVSNPSENDSYVEWKDLLSHGQYIEVKQITERTVWNWVQTIHNCTVQNDMYNVTSLCHIFGVDVGRHEGIQSVTKDVKVSQNNFPIGERTMIRFANESLLASHQCEKYSVPIANQCLWVISLQNSENLSFLKLTDTCQGYNQNSSLLSVSLNIPIISTLQRILRVYSGANIVFSDNMQNVVYYDVTTQSYSQSQNSSEFVACTTEPQVTNCPAGHIPCSGGCISETFMCDGTQDCQNGADEQNCNNICTTAVSVSVYFCQHQCHPDNCTCHYLHFHCPSGGCLPSAKLCDGHQDCVEGGDERFCPSHYLSFFEISRTSSVHSTRSIELFPDVVRKTGEHSYTVFKLSVLAEQTNDCNLAIELPCGNSHPGCYPIHSLCLYDHTDNGRLKYCSDGLHLRNCESMACSGSFKCWLSYCIPAHKVCNDKLDCPYGDDEDHCPVRACINMLRCGNICVHPNEICDGSVHCREGEDELTCGAPTCKTGCQCFGYSVRCTHLSFDVSFQNIKMFSLKVPDLTVSQSLFVEFRILLLLDLSRCSISGVLQPNVFISLNMLLKLDLSYNLIESASENTFVGLSSLRHLDMSWNPLRRLDIQTVDSISVLDTLILRHTKLHSLLFIAVLSKGDGVSLVDMSYSGVVSLGDCSLRRPMLKLLNITGTLLTYSRTESSRCFDEIVSVISDQTGLCCLSIIKGKCNIKSQTRDCPYFFGHNAWLSNTYASIGVVFSNNIIVIIYSSYVHGADTIFLKNLAIGNMLLLVPLYMFSRWQSVYGTEISFYEKPLSSSIQCNLAGGVMFLSTQVSISFLFLGALEKYNGIVHGKRDHNSVLRYILYSGVWLAWTFIIFIWRLFLRHSEKSKITHCLFGYLDSPLQYVLGICGIINTFLDIAVASLYFSIMSTIVKSHTLTKIGRKHGKSSFKSTLTRLVIITIASVLSILFPSLVMMIVSFRMNSHSDTIQLLIVLLLSLSYFSCPLIFVVVKRSCVDGIKQLFTCRISRIRVQNDK